MWPSVKGNVLTNQIDCKTEAEIEVYKKIQVEDKVIITYSFFYSVENRLYLLMARRRLLDQHDLVLLKHVF